MKKILKLSFIIAVTAFLGACSSEKETLVFVPPAPLTNQTTTVMVYLEGSDLESDNGAGTKNILQMMNARSSEYLNVVIQTGASDINYNDQTTRPPNNTVTNPPVKNWLNVQRHEINEDNITMLEDLGRGCSSSLGITSNCVEMGSSDTLRDFIEYSVDTFPADRYIVVLWDHGGGAIGGYGGAPAKSMNINNVKKALDEAAASKKIRFEIVGFDACLMGASEFAYNLKNTTKYLVASEELEPGDGWDYTTILSAIAQNPKLTGAEIGKTIADSFITFNSHDELLTMSVTDLSKIDAVVHAIDVFSQKSLELFNRNKAANWVDFFNARNNSDEFGAMPLEKDFVNAVDIADFAATLDIFGDESYLPYTKMLVDAVNDAVVYNITSSMHRDSKGLSFWLPFHFNGDVANNNLALYETLYGSGLAKFSNTYMKLLKEMLTYAIDTPSTLTLTTTPVVAGKVEANIVSNFGIDDVLLMRDISTVADIIEPVLVTMGEVTIDGAENFIVNADYDNKILTLNGNALFVEPGGRASATNNNAYILSIPLYFQKNAFEPVQGVTMLATFDFSNGEFDINSSLTPAGSIGKESIELTVGNILTIPTVTMDVEGEVHIVPSVVNITIQEPEGKDLVLARTAYTVTPDNYALVLTNLKGEKKLSEFFPTTPASALMKDGADKSKALAEALQKPIWIKKTK